MSNLSTFGLGLLVIVALFVAAFVVTWIRHTGQTKASQGADSEKALESAFTGAPVVWVRSPDTATRWHYMDLALKHGYKFDGDEEMDGSQFLVFRKAGGPSPDIHVC